MRVCRRSPKFWESWATPIRTGAWLTHWKHAPPIMCYTKFRRSTSNPVGTGTRVLKIWGHWGTAPPLERGRGSSPRNTHLVHMLRIEYGRYRLNRLGVNEESQNIWGTLGCRSLRTRAWLPPRNTLPHLCYQHQILPLYTKPFRHR